MARIKNKTRALDCLKNAQRFYQEKNIQVRDPLEQLLILAFDPDLRIDLKIKALESATKYFHGRLVTMQHTGEDGGAIQHQHILFDLMKNPAIAKAMETLSFAVEGAQSAPGVQPASTPRQLPAAAPAGSPAPALPILDAEPLDQ